jgi:putative membrane protein
MAPLDARARALTAASARRVALVTTVSPRALVDIAFVIYESIKLGGDIARLYGARPGLFGTWRLLGAILAHLAVTGGLVLTDGVVEQLVGQGLAAKLSARLGEGIVNGLMTVRVGIAAMRVVRPLPFETQRQPMVKDFMAELANVTKQPPSAA